MSSILEKKRVANDKWQISVRVSGRPVIHECFDTREKAEGACEEIENLVREYLMLGAPTEKNMRVVPLPSVDFYDRRLRDIIMDFAYGEVNPATGKRPGVAVELKGGAFITPKGAKRLIENPRLPQIGYLRRYLKTVLNNIGDVVLAEAKGSWVKRYTDKMRANLSSKGTVFSYNLIAKQLILMKAACIAAADREDIEEPRLYFNTKKFPKGWKNSRDRRLEPGEHQLIMAQLNKARNVNGLHWRCLYRLALETGARLQELTLAEWHEFDSPRIWIIPKEHTKKNKMRMVSLSPKAERILRLLRAISRENSKHVFHSFGTTSAVSNGWRYRMARAGVVGLRCHDLRHEAISRMMVHPNKISMPVIQLMVGHASPEMTLKYTHLRPKDFVGLFS
jgi:integrase